MNIAGWLQTNWLDIAALAGALHVFLNVIGKLANNKSIQGLDNLLLGLLNAFGIKAGSSTPPNA